MYERKFNSQTKVFIKVLSKIWCFFITKSIVYRVKCFKKVLKDATNKKDRYFIIQGKPNYAQGTAILLGGIIGASALDKRQETGKANWEITSVTKSEFDNSCK